MYGTLGDAGRKITFLHLCLGEVWLMCGVGVLEELCGRVPFWRKASTNPGLFSEKVMGQVSSREGLVASLRRLVPET